jgi:flagellar hook-associated protein 1
MADLMQIGLSGIYTSQANLTTTSHNISNVSTEGYSRQSVSVEANVALGLGSNFVGTGSVVTSINRAYDQFAFTENAMNTTSYAYYQEIYTQANQMDLLLSSENTSATTSVLSMFSSMSSVADNPSLLESRDVFLQDAANMANQYNTLYSKLDSQYDSINASIGDAATVITELAQSISSLNSKIAIVTGSANGGDANDLLDKRNLAITQLSEYVNVSVVAADNSMVNVFIGSGQSLVMGNTYQSVITQNGDPDTSRTELALSFKGQVTNIDGNKLGGQVGASFNSRENDIEVAMNKLGQSVIGLTYAINEQQKLGQDLNGDIGGDIFNDINSTSAMQNRVLSNSDNQGDAVLSVSIDDISELSADEFTLSVSSIDAAGVVTFAVTNNTTGKITETSANALTDNHFDIPDAGISVGIDIKTMALQVGDEYTLRPTRLGAMEVSVEQTDPEKVAAAAAEVIISVNSLNTGTGEFRVSKISDKSNSLYMDEDNPLTINITSNTGGVITYDVMDKNGIIVNDPTSGSLTGLTTTIDSFSGKATFDVGGVSVEMESGEPVAGDAITLNYNETGDGDSSNMLLMTALQTAKTMNGGKSTFQDIYSGMVSEVGSKTANADVAMQSASILKDQSFERIQSLSGVNMDEEAANLLMYQQYYSAAARVITVAGELFDTLLNAAR